MSYMLYLRRSLLRRPQRHLSLFVILTCAFILPLLISICRDSSAYGTEQMLLNLSKGSAFQISNADEADTAFFEGINGMSAPRYENGVICLSILSDEEWQDFWAFENYSEKVSDRIEKSGKANLIVTAFEYGIAHGIPDGSSDQSGLLILNLFIILLSALTVGSAYKSHIRRFSSDMGVLRSMGAENRQIFTIFIAEFLVVFAASALAAVLISAGVMKLLFATYLEVRDSEGLSWMIFKINPWNTALHIAAFFVVLLAVIVRALIKSSRESTVSAIRGDIQELEMKKNPPKLKFKTTPEKSLASLWLSRTNKTHSSCLWVAVPIMTVFLFLFSYLSLDVAFISEAPEYELMFSKNARYAGGFTQEDIDFVRSLPQVDTVNCRRDAAREIFNPEAGGLLIDVMDIKLTSPELHRETEELLMEHFPGMEYSIHNYQAVAEEGQELSTGIYLMLMFIFSAMFIFVLIIVRMKLRDYIDDSRKTIKTLWTVGASNGAIMSSFTRQSAVSSVAAAAVSAVLSLALLLLATIPAAVKPSLDLPLAAVYISISVLTVAAFILPVRRAVRGILSKRSREA